MPLNSAQLQRYGNLLKKYNVTKEQLDQMDLDENFLQECPVCRSELLETKRKYYGTFQTCLQCMGKEKMVKDGLKRYSNPANPASPAELKRLRDSKITRWGSGYDARTGKKNGEYVG